MIEAVSNGKTMLMIARRPAAYVRKGLGPKQIAYLISKRWIDARTVKRRVVG
jgi:hypothetical protein